MGAFGLLKHRKYVSAKHHVVIMDGYLEELQALNLFNYRWNDLEVGENLVEEGHVLVSFILLPWS